MHKKFLIILYRKESVHSSSSEETRSGAGVGGGVGVNDERVKSLSIPRAHKRSLSSMGEENPIPPGPGPLQRRMYVTSTACRHVYVQGCVALPVMYIIV